MESAVSHTSGLLFTRAQLMWLGGAVLAVGLSRSYPVALRHSGIHSPI
jgi:hypothetical protein